MIDVSAHTNSHDDFLERGISRALTQTVDSALDLIATGRAQPQPQSEATASPAPKIQADDRIVAFSRRAAEVINRVRALAPRPAAIARFRGKTVKLLSLCDSGPLDQPQASAVGGEVIAANPKERLAVAVGGRAVEVRLLQPEGKSAQSGVEFIRGYRVQVGDRFEAAI